jgi:predicted transcriptional regulator
MSMAERHRTKDESFMLRLYDEAAKIKDFDAAFDRYRIGQFVGLQPKAVDTICVLLAQANFIKKNGPTEISITPQGIRLVHTLREP